MRHHTGTIRSRQVCFNTEFAKRKPNAGSQAPPIAGATQERRLLAVACRPMILIEAPSSAYLRGMLVVGEWSLRRGGDLRRCYPKHPPLSCGIDVHARTMSVCLVNQNGEILVHPTYTAHPATCLTVLAP